MTLLPTCELARTAEPALKWGFTFVAKQLHDVSTNLRALQARDVAWIDCIEVSVVLDLVRPNKLPQGWSFLKALQVEFQYKTLRSFLKEVRKKAGLPKDVPLLRIFDVLAWMEGKGYGPLLN